MIRGHEKTEILTVPSLAYPTIQSAVNAAMPGDIVEILSGAYNENVVVEGKNNITIRGRAREIITISPEDPTERGISVSVDSFNVTIQNLNVEGFGSGILLSGSECRLIDLYVINNSSIGIHVKGDNNLLINNRLILNQIAGLSMDGSFNTVKNNIIFNNPASGINNSENPVNDNLIINNTIANSQAGILWAAKASVNNKFLNNIIVDNGTGFAVQNDRNLIKSNIIRDNQEDGLDIGSDKNKVIKNVICSDENGVVIVGNKNKVVDNVIICNRVKNIINTGSDNLIEDNGFSKCKN